LARLRRPPARGRVHPKGIRIREKQQALIRDKNLNCCKL
jgi:hypothetical protein